MIETKTKYSKVIVSGNIVEVYEMEKAPYMGDKTFKPKEDGYNALEVLFDENDRENSNLALREKWREEQEEKQDRKLERREQTARDARNKVRRLALSNFTNHSKFITLSFKENIQDIDMANEIFRKFIQKKIKRYMNKKDTDFKLKYIAVIEFQKRGAVHYHMICNLPFIKWDNLVEMWRDCCGEGGLHIRDITSVDNVGAYLIKYMTKNVGDLRLEGRKMYLTSQGLEQPRVYKGDSASLIIGQYEGMKKVFTNSYESEHLGTISYREYNLSRLN